MNKFQEKNKEYYQHAEFETAIYAIPLELQSTKRIKFKLFLLLEAASQLKRMKFPYLMLGSLQSLKDFRAIDYLPNPIIILHHLKI